MMVFSYCIFTLVITFPKFLLLLNLHPSMEENTFDPDLIRAIFRLVWEKRGAEREKNQLSENEAEAGPSTTKRSRLTTANANALKLSCELLRVFVAEAIQRAAAIAEAEGSLKIEATHLERILPQLLLDF